MSGISTNRTDITLPSEVSQEILAKTQEGSAIMRLARQIALPGRGATIPVITSDPEAAWVAETASKPVSNPGLSTKIMAAYKLAVIVPFSDEFRRDAATLYDEIVRRIPNALAKKFDATVLGAVSKPGDNFDNFASCTTQSLSSDAYAGLVAADTDIATHGAILNGFALSPQAKGVLLAACDDNGRPLFINSVAEGAIPQILGAPTYINSGLYKAGTVNPAVPNIVGIAGDWNKALYGTVEGVKIDISREASLTYKNQSNQDVTINLFQQNMFAVRAEIEVGFRADTSVFDKLTASAEVSG